MSKTEEILVDRKSPKWWQVGANAGEIELTLGPGHVTPGNVKKLTKRFGLQNPRVNFGVGDGRYTEKFPREYALEGNAATVIRTCKNCGSKSPVDLWEVVKKVGKSGIDYFGEKYRWSHHDRRGRLRDVTFHAGVPKASVEPFYRFMEHMDAGEELPKEVREFLLKEAASRGGSK